jgi:hypothetical protein
MSLTLTQVYLEVNQKKALVAQAKSSGRKTSDLIREAVDGLLLGVNPTELKQLDIATLHAEKDIKEMVKALDANAKSHKSFMAEMTKLRAKAELI